MHYRRLERTGSTGPAHILRTDISKTLSYASWAHMIQRCFNIKNTQYHDYGGRGITVCGNWIGVPGYHQFIKDLGERLSKEYSIDRIDNDRNYSCGHCEECIKNGWNFNCRWATRAEQAKNKRHRYNKTGFPGAHVKGSSFTSYIYIEGVHKSLGTFKTPEEASEAYLLARSIRDNVG